MKNNKVLILVVVLVFASIGFILNKNKKAIDAKKVVVDRSNIAVAVSVSNAVLTKASGGLHLPATLEPARQADISAVSAGKITSFNVSLGSRVAAGQVLGTIDKQQQQINLKDAKDALAKAQRDYQLSKELFQGNAGTEQSVRDAERTLESAKARLLQQSQQVGDASIKAPLGGIITSKTAEVGEYANPGTPLATVVDIYTLKAVVFVSENDVYRLKLKQEAKITADVLAGKSFNGSISYIAPVADDNHNYRVELKINNQGATLKAGTYIKVNFNLGADYEALQIPKIALVEGTKNPFVYVLKGDQASIRKITVGREQGENIEVLSGLTNGEEVVISGQINLTEGSKVIKTATK